MKIDRIHHVAYRCMDAKETVEWYGEPQSGSTRAEDHS